MAGQNRLVNSDNTKKGGSQSALADALKNANEVAIKISKKK